MKTTVICVGRDTATSLVIKIGRTDGWNYDTTLMSDLYKLEMQVNGSPQLITSNGNSIIYDPQGTGLSPFPTLTHIGYFTVPAGINNGVLVWKDSPNDIENRVPFTVGVSVLQVVSDTAHRYRMQPKQSPTFSVTLSGSNAVTSDSTTPLDTVFQINALANNQYQLQHVTSGLCLSSGGGSEVNGQLCTLVANNTGNATQKFTFEPNNNGGFCLKFVSNPAKGIVIANNNLVLADFAINNGQSFNFMTYSDSRGMGNAGAGSGGGGGGGGGGIGTPALQVVSVTSSTVVLDWADIGGATGYVVERATAQNGSYTSVGTPGNSAFTDTSLTAGTTYWYRASANNGVIASPNSTPVGGTTSASNTGGGGSSTTATPVVTLNSQNTIWNRQYKLQGAAAANAVVYVRDGSTLIGQTTANSAGAWTYALQTPLPTTSQLNFVAQLSGENPSVPSANVSVTVAPMTAYFVGIISNGLKYKAVEVTMSAGGTFTATTTAISPSERNTLAEAMADMYGNFEIV